VRELLLLGGLAGAAALYALSRTQRGQAAAVDAVEAVVVTGSAIGRALARGVRNHNPGNIRHSGIKWKGMSASQTDSEFVQFIDPSWGFRALGKNLTAYSNRGLRSVESIINTWAPPKGRDSQGRAYSQNTSSYVRSVANALGVGPSDTIDVRARLADLAEAIAKHENGGSFYKRTDIEQWVRIA
jgi:hypothetical protein